MSMGSSGAGSISRAHGICCVCVCEFGDVQGSATTRARPLRLPKLQELDMPHCVRRCARTGPKVGGMMMVATQVNGGVSAERLDVLMGWTHARGELRTGSAIASAISAGAPPGSAWLDQARRRLRASRAVAQWPPKWWCSAGGCWFAQGALGGATFAKRGRHRWQGPRRSTQTRETAGPQAQDGSGG